MAVNESRRALFGNDNSFIGDLIYIVTELYLVYNAGVENKNVNIS